MSARTAVAVMVAVVLAGVSAAGEDGRTIDFDDAESWQAEPGWLSDSAADYDLSVKDGVGSFSVRSPSAGMKWRFAPGRRLSPVFGALVLRYRATGYDTGHGDYTVWLSGGTGGRPIVSPADIRADGQWHTLAVNLSEAPFEEAVSFVAVAVYAKEDAPARLAIDYLDLAAGLPQDAEVKSISGPEHKSLTIPLVERADELEAHHDWLTEDADDGRFAATSDAETLALTVDQPARGMKWSLRFDPPIERKEMRFATVRYRARSVQPYQDYAIWFGSEAGGMPQQSERVLQMPELIDDNRWHTETLRLTESFPIAEIALQLRADAPDALFEIDRMMVSSRRPRLPASELVELSAGWGAAKLAAGDFKAVDLSTVANAGAASRLGFWGMSDWLGPGAVTAEGVPFVVLDADRDIAVTKLGHFDALDVPLSGRASEILLLMFARLPDQYTLGVKDPRPLRWLAEPEAVVFDVRYADGSTVTAFPRRMPDGAHRVGRQLGVYRLPADAGRELAGITLRENMRTAEFALAAVTLNTSGPPLLPPAEFPQWQVRERAEQPHLAPPALEADADTLRVEAGLSRLTLKLGEDRPALEEIVNTMLGAGGAGDLLRIRVGEKEMALADMRLLELDLPPGAGNTPGRAIARLATDDPPLQVEVGFTFTGADEPLLSLSVRNTGDEAVRAEVDFPAIGPLRLAEAPDDDWYLFPRRGTVLSNRCVGLSAPHGGMQKLQFMDVYSAATGGGLYVMTHDMEGNYGYFDLAKSDEGTSLAVRYRWVDLPAGESVALPDAVVAAHAGDWHEALRRYSDWVHSWYRPVVERKQWFREVFNFRQHRLRGGLLDFDEMQYRFDEIIERDREALGCIDYLHIFDWSETRQWGRVGDYDPWEEIPGPDELRAAVERVQADGVPVGLYLEGYLISKRSRVGQAHGAEWTLLNANGEEYGYFSTPEEPNWSICPSVGAWQAYMERAYSRAAEQTGAMGLYIDEFGFGGPGKLCYNDAHDHAIPMPPVRGEREFIRRVRQVLPDDRVLYTEEVPDPVTCQYQDGAFCYSAISSSDELAPSHLELLRFVLPDFKILELNFYCAMADGNWNRVKRPFFNGDGWWLQGDPYAAYDEPAREHLRRCFSLCHEYVDCFTTMDAEPLVATLQPGLFANRFPGGGRTLWTLYNATYTSVEGPAIAVEHRPGARYADAWHGQDLTPEIREGTAILSLRVDPHGLGCVVQIAGE